MAQPSKLNAHDLKILRELGEWKARACETPENREKIKAWLDHDQGLPGSRVMVICETGFIPDTGRGPFAPDLQCVDPAARALEGSLRQTKFEIEELRDDHVAMPWIEYNPHIEMSDFGVPSGQHRTAGAAEHAFQYRPPLKNLDEADFARLRHREFHWNRQAEQQERDWLEDIFRGILPVRRRFGGGQLIMPITYTCLNFVGLDGFMLLMYDNPDGLHRLLAFIRDDHLGFIRFLEDNRLLNLNNEADYTGSGCMGFTTRLPAPDFTGTVRTKDMWYYCDSQESVGISPRQFGEFAFPYIRAIAERFGGVYYGCCEPLDSVLDYLDTLANLRRVSVSYWADEEKMARFCRNKGLVYSRKSGPTFFMGETFDEGRVRAYLDKTVACAAGCALEFIQRDAMLCENQPQRFVRWVELAREAGAKHR